MRRVLPDADSFTHDRFSRCGIPLLDRINNRGVRHGIFDKIEWRLAADRCEHGQRKNATQEGGTDIRIVSRRPDRFVPAVIFVHVGKDGTLPGISTILSRRTSRSVT